MSSGISKVDLLSVDNRRGRAGAEREQRLVDELVETRRELQRTRSMMSEDGRRGGLNYGSTLKVPINSGSSRNLR